MTMSPPPVDHKEKGDVFVLPGKDASGSIWRQRTCTIQRPEWFLLTEIGCKYLKTTHNVKKNIKTLNVSHEGKSLEQLR